MQKLCIFAASPSDMSAEREKVETVAATLKPLADNLDIVIEVVDWRVVVPDAARPQQIIFDQLKPDTWGVFVGILWHRFGTPTGAKDAQTQKDYLSGTEEEFHTAYRLWKQHGKPRIMMYRCTRPFPFDVDPDQLKRVNEFFKLIEDPKSEVGYSSEIAILAFKLKQWAEARQWAEYVIGVAREITQEVDIALAYYVLARCWEEEGRAELALPLALEASRIYERLEKQEDLANAQPVVERLSVNRNVD